VKALQRFEICTLQLPHLLRYEDRNSMRHSIETRLPFLDYRLVEAAVSLPADYKIRDGWTKYILRRVAQKLLPDDVAWRRNKLGFEAPERIWLGAHEAAMKQEIARSSILREIADHARLQRDFSQLSLKERWAYFSLAAWERVYGVSWA
jgi:asparagine synthase (glutamine-hydrolysing)